MQCLFLGNLYETDAQNSILHVHFPFEIYRFICIRGGVRGRGNAPTQRCCLTKANTHFCVCSVNTEISKYWRCNKSKMVNGAQRETAAAEGMARREGGREVCMKHFGRHREGWQISIQPRGGPQKLKQMLLSSLESTGNVRNITMINVQRVAFRIAFTLKFMQSTRFLYLCSIQQYKNTTGNIVLFLKSYLYEKNNPKEFAKEVLSFKLCKPFLISK